MNHKVTRVLAQGILIRVLEQGSLPYAYFYFRLMSESNLTWFLLLPFSLEYNCMFSVTRFEFSDV
jgi:hypothetical protein